MSHFDISRNESTSSSSTSTEIILRFISVCSDKKSEVQFSFAINPVRFTFGILFNCRQFEICFDYIMSTFARNRNDVRNFLNVLRIELSIVRKWISGKIVFLISSIRPTFQFFILLDSEICLRMWSDNTKYVRF